MNRIQLVGRFSKAKQRLLLADKGKWVELLFPPSVNELGDVEDGQYVQIVGDIWSHPEREDGCLVRAAIIDPFPGDKDPWSSGRLRLNNCRWFHDESFLKPSAIHGTTESRDNVYVTMPLVESRWSKKIGGIIRPHGHVDLEVAFNGTSKLQCVSIVDDDTCADDSGGKPHALGGCAPLEWHDKTVERAAKQRNRESIPPKLRRRVFMRDGFKCQECGALLDYSRTLLPRPINDHLHRPPRQRQHWPLLLGQL